MRETKRIKRILSLVEQIWSKYPDLRFNQLVNVLSIKFSEANENKYMDYTYSKIEDSRGIYFMEDDPTVDLFYVEDDQYEEFLIDYLNRQ